MNKRVYYYRIMDGKVEKVRRASRPDGWLTFQEFKQVDSKAPTDQINTEVANDSGVSPDTQETSKEKTTNRFEKQGEINDDQILKDTIKKLVKAEIQIKALEAENIILRKQKTELEEVQGTRSRMEASSIKEDEYFEMKRQNIGYKQRLEALEKWNKQLETLLAQKGTKQDLDAFTIKRECNQI